jgi:3-hydroxyacyl-CoA dehydrogenase/enoyl-CoA hydratase/3-hydroxybutyryl-CoA epimerase/enoyl-CoA isomerase
VQVFHNDQMLKKLFREHARNARPVKQGAVLGAGIMSGGIAYTSALRGTPVLMKDIAQKQLHVGTGRPVPISAALLERLEKLTCGEMRPAG